MAWNIDYEHDSEEVILLKRHISEQDNRYSTLQGQLIKAKNLLDDNEAALDETTNKLRLEADRATRLDEELRECRETLDKEKFMRQNADIALRSVTERGKDEEVARRELQQALESVSSRDTASNSIISNLRNEKVTLERRMRELEANLQQVISAATPKRKGRARSSSLSDMRITTLERDLDESQSSVTELRAELTKAREKLRCTEDALCRVENDKTVLERRTADEIKSLQRAIASKDEELMQLSSGLDAGLAQEREDELIRRVEEEEANVLALEQLLSETQSSKAMEGALQKAEKRLAAETSKVRGLEEKNTALNRDVKRVRDALEETHSQVQGFKVALDDSNSLVQALQERETALTAQLNSRKETIRSLRDAQSGGHASNAASQSEGATTDVETMEKLLSAVDRLRGERDELRRQLEFLQVESKFTVEALKSKINPEAASRKVDAATEDPRISQLQAEVRELLERLAQTSSRSRVNLPSPAVDPSRLGLIASASLVMVEHLQTRVDLDVELKERVCVEVSRLRSQLQDAAVSHDESLRTTHGIQQSALDMQHQLHDTRQQRDDLLLRVEHLQSQIAANARIREQFRELQSSLEGTAARLSDTTKTLEDAESERNSLKVELVNLHKDMALAQEELKQAEQRYSDLQNQQLSSMSSSQVNRKLKEQIEELEGRVTRRTEQIGIHQHDIKRLETNLKLQEDRISEMTSELEVAMSEKESMVEDCADAREARDRALKKAEDLEDAVATLETQTQALEEQRELEVTTLVEVWSSTLAQSRSSMTRLRAVAHQMGAAEADMARQLKLVSTEHNHTTALLNQQASELELVQKAAITHREESREAVVALAVTQTASAEIRRAMSHDRNQIYALLLATRNELHDRLKEIESLQDQIRRMRLREDADSIEQQSANLEEVTKLQQANTDLDELRTELEGQVTQSRKELRFASEQQDQLHADMASIRAQMARLQSDHAEELESLRGKLQQVAVDLQEAREAHAASEKACSELSTTNAELESRLDNISQRQDTDNELIAELQSHDAGHTERMLDMQNRLDNASMELQQMTREKSELEIFLHQTKTEHSQAKDAMEDRVSELLEERDALQERLVEVESSQAKEMAQEQRRLRDLEVESDTLRAQLDKATADQRRMRTTFETELRESAERLEESRAQLDDVKAQLFALEAEFDGMEGRLETALEEKDVMEAKNTNLESEIQRTFSIQRYLESQLKDSANESAAVKTELEQMEEKYMRAERDGKAAEMQLTFQTTQHNQAVATLKREIQLLQAASRPDERVQELEEKISYMDEMMHSKTQEIEENDDRFIELHREKKKLTTKVETLTRKVQTLQSKLATLKDAAANQNPTQPTASTSKQISPVPQQPLVTAPAAQYTRRSPSTSAVSSTSPSRSRAASGPSALSGGRTPERQPASSVFRAKTPEPAKAPTFRLQDPTQVAGKKRAAPDDGHEPAPVQGFTSDGVLATGYSAATTPRRRKSPRTGFTPVRNTTTHPLTTLAPEPAVQAAPGAAPVISDVTNSPRGQSQTDVKVKRSWLDTHRVKAAQSGSNTTARTTSARPGAAYAERFS